MPNPLYDLLRKTKCPASSKEIGGIGSLYCFLIGPQEKRMLLLYPVRPGVGGCGELAAGGVGGGRASWARDRRWGITRPFRE